MAFKAILTLDGKEYRLLHCNYALQRDVDPTGRPSSQVMGGTISFEIEATDDASLWEWMINQWTHKSGSIKFFKREEESTMKELKFETAYIIHYGESFDSVGGNPMMESFTISAHKMTIGNETHENEWPV